MVLAYLHKDKNDWVSACRKLQVEGIKSKERSTKMWNEFVKVDMKWFGLFKKDAQNRDRWRSLTTGS